MDQRVSRGSPSLVATLREVAEPQAPRALRSPALVPPSLGPGTQLGLTSSPRLGSPPYMSASNNSESSPSSSPAPSRASRFILAGIVLAIALALDLWTKQWAWDNLREQPAVEVISGLFYLKFGFNTGSAFSFLRDAEWARSFFNRGDLPRPRLHGLARFPDSDPLSLGLYLYRPHRGRSGRQPSRSIRSHRQGLDQRSPRASLRRRRLPPVSTIRGTRRNYWPIFNVADMALVCGVGILLLHLRKQGKEALGAADEAPSLKNAEEAEGSAA